jgi:xylulokinase
VKDVVLGFDVGTSSSKAVLVALDGEIVAQRSTEHSVSRPHSGWAESDSDSWWAEFIDSVRDLLANESVCVIAVGVSGMGPCLTIADENGVPLRPSILYGIDTRATEQIQTLENRYGKDAVLQKCGSALSTQAVGPKVAWLAQHEPELFLRARKMFMPSSYLVFLLTGEYVLDHHSASQCVPMYNLEAQAWDEPWSSEIAGDALRLPRLMWPGDIAGSLSSEAARQTGLAEGLPVITGTIDAWAEAISGDAHNVGDLMLMYGTTMFLINTVRRRVLAPAFWGTVGALPGTLSLAGGMATSGAITGWVRELSGSPEVSILLREAEASGPGARGLLMLPYFAGERTPIADPSARGHICGLTISHQRGDLYRAALEATAFGVRHNIEVMRGVGASIDRVVAIGGGTRGGLWTQLVSDIVGIEQSVPEKTVGASYGMAFLAAQAVTQVSIKEWNPVSARCEPAATTKHYYDELYEIYRGLYSATADLTHRLVQLRPPQAVSHLSSRTT